jgi:metal-sulfur cluster biosynthetic enzyme
MRLQQHSAAGYNGPVGGPSETLAHTREASLTGPMDKLAEVWMRLATVADPELDQSVTDMKFISTLDVDAGNHVSIAFRLPTYWCAANFAFMMADDMRTAVAELLWVSSVSVVLDEHMYADKINAGLAEGRSFADTFGDEADGDIEDVRKIFLRKAFQRRQEAMLLHLRELGYGPGQLIGMTLAELEDMTLDGVGMRARTRYLERRSVAGTVSPISLAFVASDGTALQLHEFAAYLRALRSVRVNAEFNGALCSGLLSARYAFDTTTPLKSQQANPTT